jgi:calcium-dependent protein kinase
VDRITSYYLRKLHMEIAILKSLDHPNIIKLQDVFFGKRSVYIVTDLCRGGELFELLNSGKNQGFVFREDRASKLMKDMISSVHYLHEHGIVHRDLKLENFLFEDHNSSSPLILIDFGLSKHFSQGEILTQKVGSCYYTAPEVLNGSYDHRCDVWSLGVLCYMLLTGSPPFFGKSVEDVYQAILNKEPTYTDKKFKHVSQGCMDFMKRLLTRDVRSRMSTAEALQHPFITGATFFPRYQSMGQADFDSAKSAQDSSALALLTPEKTLQIMESMEVFVAANPLTKLVMELVAHSLSSADLQQFRDEFQRIDKSNSGVVSLKDFMVFFDHVDPEVRKRFDGRRVFNQLRVESSFDGGDTNTVVSYHEYIAAAMHNRVLVDSARLSMIFDYLDTENSASITGDSINSALGDELATEELTKMVVDGSPSRSTSMAKG